MPASRTTTGLAQEIEQKTTPLSQGRKSHDSREHIRRWTRPSEWTRRSLHVARDISKFDPSYRRRRPDGLRHQLSRSPESRRGCLRWACAAMFKNTWQ